MNGTKNVNNIMIIIALCSIGGIVFGGFLLYPKFQEFQDVNKRVESKQTKLEYKTKYFLNLQKTEVEIKEYQSELVKIDSALPNEPSVPSLFDFLQKNTSQSGLVINNMGSFTINVSSKYPGTKEVALGLSVSGSYESLKNFLSILENSSRMFDVESVSFNSAQNVQERNNQQTDTFVFILALKVYSY